MGTSAAYYSIWTRGFTPDELREKIKVVSSSGKKREDAIYERMSAFLSPEEIAQMRAGAAAAFCEGFGGRGWPQGNRAAIAYRPDVKWLPLFETNICEGCTASSRDAMELSELFGAPVFAFSIFDSDVLFVSYCDAERGICYDYAKPNYEEFEDYDADQYSTEFPDFLAEFCDRAELEAVWDNPDEVFADDRLEKLCQLMQMDLLHTGDQPSEGYELISAP